MAASAAYTWVKVGDAVWALNYIKIKNKHICKVKKNRIYMYNYKS